MLFVFILWEYLVYEFFWKLVQHCPSSCHVVVPFSAIVRTNTPSYSFLRSHNVEAIVHTGISTNSTFVSSLKVLRITTPDISFIVFNKYYPYKTTSTLCRISWSISKSWKRIYVNLRFVHYCFFLWKIIINSCTSKYPGNNFFLEFFENGTKFIKYRVRSSSSIRENFPWGFAAHEFPFHAEYFPAVVCVLPFSLINNSYVSFFTAVGFQTKYIELRVFRILYY